MMKRTVIGILIAALLVAAMPAAALAATGDATVSPAVFTGTETIEIRVEGVESPAITGVVVGDNALAPGAYSVGDYATGATVTIPPGGLLAYADGSYSCQVLYTGETGQAAAAGFVLRVSQSSPAPSPDPVPDPDPVPVFGADASYAIRILTRGGGSISGHGNTVLQGTAGQPFSVEITPDAGNALLACWVDGKAVQLGGAGGAIPLGNINGARTVEAVFGAAGSGYSGPTLFPATSPATSPAAGTQQWRVIVRRLNIRSGPGTSYTKTGTLAMDQIVIGKDLGNGWIEIGEGQYISKQYVVPVTGGTTTGNYTTTASSLNVRSGPGAGYAKTGSLTKGTVVEVVAIQNGWAQLASGGWVSMMYLI